MMENTMLEKNSVLLTNLKKTKPYVIDLSKIYTWRKNAKNITYRLLYSYIIGGFKLHKSIFHYALADEVYTEEIIKSTPENSNPEGLADILNALEFLHDKGLVHRDLRPQTILKHNGAWKLADFGLISQDKEILSQTITTSKQAFGTTMYVLQNRWWNLIELHHKRHIFIWGNLTRHIYWRK
jgi:serine/threonine protein kinase